MLTFRIKGDFSNTEKFLKKVKEKKYQNILERYARQGVTALSAATPKDTGKTAGSWSYEIKRSSDSLSVYWKNDNVQNGVMIAIILQYGHGTRNGGYVAGRDYINPAMRPIFDKMAQELWKEVIG